jgi:hypothetical protein
MREWMLTDQRIAQQQGPYKVYVNDITADVITYLVDNVEDITEYWELCDWLDNC